MTASLRAASRDMRGGGVFRDLMGEGRVGGSKGASVPPILHVTKGSEIIEIAFLIHLIVRSRWVTNKWGGEVISFFVISGILTSL